MAQQQIPWKPSKSSADASSPQPPPPTDVAPPIPGSVASGDFTTHQDPLKVAANSNDSPALQDIPDLKRSDDLVLQSPGNFATLQDTPFSNHLTHKPDVCIEAAKDVDDVSNLAEVMAFENEQIEVDSKPVLEVLGSTSVVSINYSKESFESPRGHPELRYTQKIFTLTNSMNTCFEQRDNFVDTGWNGCWKIFGMDTGKYLVKLGNICTDAAICTDNGNNGGYIPESDLVLHIERYKTPRLMLSGKATSKDSIRISDIVPEVKQFLHFKDGLISNIIEPFNSGTYVLFLLLYHRRWNGTATRRIDVVPLKTEQMGALQQLLNTLSNVEKFCNCIGGIFGATSLPAGHGVSNSHAMLKDSIDAGGSGARPPELRAVSILLAKGIKTTGKKTIGVTHSIHIADISYVRMEMCLVGLHLPSMSRIVYMTTKLNGLNEPLAVSIISSEGYEDDADNPGVLVYSGQGGNVQMGKDITDHKLVMGNLTLEKNLYCRNEVSVIRGVKDSTNPLTKVYFSDGLFTMKVVLQPLFGYKNVGSVKALAVGDAELWTMKTTTVKLINHKLDQLNGVVTVSRSVDHVISQPYKQLQRQRARLCNLRLWLFLVARKLLHEMDGLNTFLTMLAESFKFCDPPCDKESVFCDFQQQNIEELIKKKRVQKTLKVSFVSGGETDEDRSQTIGEAVNGQDTGVVKVPSDKVDVFPHVLVKATLKNQGEPPFVEKKIYAEKIIINITELHQYVEDAAAMGKKTHDEAIMFKEAMKERNDLMKAKEHINQLKRLHGKNPEFYEFLKEYDKDLPEFNDDLPTAYQHDFVFICHLSTKLREALDVKHQDSKTTTKELLHWLTCARMLNGIAASTATFIPVSMLFLGMMEIKELNSSSIEGAGKAIDMHTALKVSNEVVKTRSFQEVCVFSVIRDFAAHPSQWSFSVTFSELRFILSTRLRNFCKANTFERFRKETNRKVAISFLLNEPAVVSFLEDEKPKGASPLSKFVKDLREGLSQMNDTMGEPSVVVGKHASIFNGKVYWSIWLLESITGILSAMIWFFILEDKDVVKEGVLLQEYAYHCAGMLFDVGLVQV